MSLCLGRDEWRRLGLNLEPCGRRAMNRVARLLTHFGVLAEEPPTARNRRERAERKDAALKEREES